MRDICLAIIAGSVLGMGIVLVFELERIHDAIKTALKITVEVVKKHEDDLK